MNSNQTVKQHYVPKVYLKRFTDDNTRKLWCLRSTKPGLTTLKQFTPTQVCYDRNFYEVENNNFQHAKRNELERKWNLLEQSWDRIIDKIESIERTLKESEIRDLILFSITLKLRNDSIRKLYFQENTKKIIDSTSLKLHTKLVEAGNNPISASLITSEVVSVMKNNQVLKNMHNQSLLDILDGKDKSTSMTVINFLVRQPKLIITSAHASPFFTNDNPGFFIDGNNKVNNIKFFCESDQMDFKHYCLPLSSKSLLFVLGDGNITKQNDGNKLHYQSLENFGTNAASILKELKTAVDYLRNKDIYCCDKETLEEFH